MKILVIEDELKIAKAIEEGLLIDGYNVTLSHSGEDAFFLLQQENYNLVVLDWMLPGRNGIEILKVLKVLKVLREGGNWTPVILLTARDTIEDRVEGLEAGADDYLVKPFAFPELQARIRSLIRRNGLYDNKKIIELSDLEINTELREVKRCGKELDLTTREYEILYFLIQNVGRPVTRDMLTREVWKIQNRVTSMDSVIDVHINRLRGKLDKPFDKPLIETIRGIGFKICN